MITTTNGHKVETLGNGSTEEYGKEWEVGREEEEKEARESRKGEGERRVTPGHDLWLENLYREIFGYRVSSNCFFVEMCLLNAFITAFSVSQMTSVGDKSKWFSTWKSVKL